VHNFFTLIVIVIAFLDTMTQLPILSPYVVSLGASALMVGAIIGGYSLINMVGNLYAGPLIDRYNRRFMISVGMILAGVAVGAYVLARNPGQLLVMRMVHGVGGAILIPAVFAWAGDRSAPGATGRSMGFAAVAVAVAATIGPAVGGVASARFGITPVFLGLGILLFVTGVVLFPLSSVRSGLSRQAAQAQPLRWILRERTLQVAYILVFGLTLAMGSLVYAFPLIVQDLGYSSARTGSLFSLFSATVIILLVSPANRLLDRFPPERVAAIGAGLMALTVLLLTGVGSMRGLMVVMVLYGTAFAALFPTTSAIIIRQAGGTHRGTAFGVYYAVYSLGFVVGPAVTGYAITLEVGPFLPAILVLVVTIFGSLGLSHKNAVREEREMLTSSRHNARQERGQEGNIGNS
jgi:MFS family permease